MRAATLRGGGYPMSTIAVRFEVGKDELIAAAALLWQNVFTGDLPKKVIEDSLREVLHRGGCDRLAYWQDDIPDEDIDTVLVWATAQVDRHWPEMFDRSGGTRGTPTHEL